MKSSILTILLALAIFLGSCNNNDRVNEHQNMNSMGNDSAMHNSPDHQMNNMGNDSLMHDSTANRR